MKRSGSSAPFHFLSMLNSHLNWLGTFDGLSDSKHTFREQYSILYQKREDQMAETAMAETDERSGPELLRHYIDNGFGSDINEAALTLGRTPEELDSMLSGDMTVDDDLEMKIRGIAEERSIDL
jgi:hypothetical protein